MVWDWERLGENLCPLDIKFHKLWLWRTLRGGSSLYEGWWVVLKRFLIKIFNFALWRILSGCCSMLMEKSAFIHMFCYCEPTDLLVPFCLSSYLEIFWANVISWWYHLLLSIQCWPLALDTSSCLSHLALYPVFYRLLIYEETVSLAPWNQTWKISPNVDNHPQRWKTWFFSERHGNFSPQP